jgi:signal transduction histidine kinase
MCLICGSLIWFSRRSAEVDADDFLNTTAHKVRRDLQAGEAEGDASELPEEENDLRSENMAMMIVAPDGRIVTASQRHGPTWPRLGDNWRVVGVPLDANTLVVGIPWAQTEKSLHRQALVLVCLGVMVVVLAAAGAWLLVGRTLSPIGSLSRQAQAASADSLCLRLLAPSEDAEMVGLVATLNGLLSRLSETAEARGRFYAAASHELRTPLQALSGHLEVGLSRERSLEEYREVVTEAYGQTRRLTSLVRDLLLLNQLDAVSVLPAPEPVDLADLCARVLQNCRPLIEQRGLQIRSEFGTEGETLLPPAHAEMLVRNLVENAVKYASPGGEVDVALTICGAKERLVIFNTCPALTPDVTDHLFEPFFRPDASRNSQTGGNGLGLAICKAISVANGWTLALIPDAQGFRIGVKF